MRGVIIQGSSKSDGNTNKIVKILLEELSFDFIDLRDKEIAAFDYEFKNQDDDFIPLVKNLVRDYDLMLFATPVYWYAMSGIMKNFFDRISDCLKIEKELGRKLRGKSLAAISCGYDEETVSGFHQPFEQSAKYLGMEYLGFLHTWMKDDAPVSKVVEAKVRAFAQQLKK